MFLWPTKCGTTPFTVNMNGTFFYFRSTFCTIQIVCVCQVNQALWASSHEDLLSLCACDTPDKVHALYSNGRC